MDRSFSLDANSLILLTSGIASFLRLRGTISGVDLFASSFSLALTSGVIALARFKFWVCQKEIAVPAITLKPTPAIANRSNCQPKDLAGEDLIGIGRLVGFLRVLTSVRLSVLGSGRASILPWRVGKGLTLFSRRLSKRGSIIGSGDRVESRNK